MGLLKKAIIGAAIYGAFKYLTKKDEITGKSVVDDLKDKVPGWIDKAKGLKDNLEGKYADSNFPK